MPSMRRGLILIVATTDPQRFDAAVALAAAEAALGGAALVYLHRGAVALMGEAVLHSAMDGGVRVIACQTGLAEAGLDLTRFDARIEGGGMVGLLMNLSDERLVLA